MAWKHCKICNININDSMGIWECVVCGSGLVEGYSHKTRNIEVCS